MVRADSSAGGSSRSSSSRRVYRQSQAEAPALPMNEIASFVLPAGAFVVVSFGISFVAFSIFFFQSVLLFCYCSFLSYVYFTCIVCWHYFPELK